MLTEKEREERDDCRAAVNPFMRLAGPNYPMKWVESCDVESRLSDVRDFDAHQCRKVLTEPFRFTVQVTVQRAAERRLRRLEKRQ